MFFFKKTTFFEDEQMCYRIMIFAAILSSDVQIHTLDLMESFMYFSVFMYFFAVTNEARMILGKEGKNVTLKPDTETQRDDLILWMFGDQDNLIAQLTGETKETTYADADERFRDRLQLDKNTGSLTIKNMTSKHSGAYKLQIVSCMRTLFKEFRVFMCCEFSG